LNCSKEVGVQYYVFKTRKQIFDCNGSAASEDKSLVAVRLIDLDTGSEITDGYDLNLVLPPSVPCYGNCKSGIDGSCICLLGLFNIKAQVAKIFRDSDIKTLKDFHALWQWKFYTSPVFWVVFLMTVWYFWTIRVVKRKYSRYCVLQNWREKEFKTISGDFKTAITVMIFSFILLISS
jgi:hypothetical protein